MNFDQEFDETQKVVPEDVPIFNADEHEIDQFLKDLYGYCVRLHNHSKLYPYLGFTEDEQAELFIYLMKNSFEPQYQLLRTITLARASNNDEDPSSVSVDQVFSDMDSLKKHVRSLKAITYKDLCIRSAAEFLYMDGLTVNEITDELIAEKFLDEYSDEEDSLLANHRRQIHKYVSSFKDFDVMVDDPERKINLI
tara:strand:+ start:496 stop:1080 length:585 start_codon:yes stop_codon:yes gene_type:complete